MSALEDCTKKIADLADERNELRAEVERLLTQRGKTLDAAEVMKAEVERLRGALDDATGRIRCAVRGNAYCSQVAYADCPCHSCKGWREFRAALATDDKERDQ